MRKLGFAVGMAALCCLVVNADLTTQVKDAGARYVSMRPVQTLDASRFVVKAMPQARHIGEDNGISSRAIETVYSATVITGAFADTMCSEFGDELQMTGAGELDGGEFAVYNCSGCTNVGTLCSQDTVVRFYDSGFSLIATIDFGTLTYDPCLDPGYGVSWSYNGLTGNGINLPATCIITQDGKNLTGTATDTGTFLVSESDASNIGSSTNDFPLDTDCDGPTAFGWYWFGGSPWANFYYVVNLDSPEPPPPPLYDNTTGTFPYGTDGAEGSWMGDDLTWEYYGFPPSPSYAINGGLLDNFQWTFWNYNTAATHAAGIISADWEVCFFDQADPSTCYGDFTIGLNYGADNPLGQFYFSRWTFSTIENYFTVPIYPGLAGVKCRALNVVWTTHNDIPGTIGQIVYEPDGAYGDSDEQIFYFDPAPEFGGDDGWYSFGWPPNPADLYYHVEVVNWLPGDMNCDGVVNLFDIDPFVMALTGGSEVPQYATYFANYPYCNPLNADADGSGTVDLFDIDPFVALLAP